MVLIITHHCLLLTSIKTSVNNFPRKIITVALSIDTEIDDLG